MAPCTLMGATEDTGPDHAAIRAGWGGGLQGCSGQWEYRHIACLHPLNPPKPRQASHSGAPPEPLKPQTTHSGAPPNSARLHTPGHHRTPKPHQAYTLGHPPEIPPGLTLWSTP